MDTYPETVIVIITSHGEIKVQEEEPAIFKIPEGINLTRINAVAPGVCNYLSSKTAQIIVERVKEIISKFDLTHGIPSNLVTLLSRQFKRFTHVDRRNIKTQGTAADILDLKMFDIHYNKAYKIIKSDPEYFAVNKEYSIDDDTLSKTYDNIILFLNTPQGELDYFSTLPPPYKTDLEDIISYLQTQKVKHILLIDLSCSSFGSTMLSARDNRSIRRETIREKWGGKTKNKYKRKWTRKLNRYH